MSHHLHLTMVVWVRIPASMRNVMALVGVLGFAGVVAALLWWVSGPHGPRTPKELEAAIGDFGVKFAEEKIKEIMGDPKGHEFPLDKVSAEKIDTLPDGETGLDRWRVSGIVKDARDTGHWTVIVLVTNTEKVLGAEVTLEGGVIYRDDIYKKVLAREAMQRR